jgi:ADP-ribose pyrophosphatase
MFPNNHPSYPDRISTKDCNYYQNVPFYESPVLALNVKTWADPQDVDESIIKERLTWKKNKLVSLERANIAFVNNKPINPQKTGLMGRGLLGRYGPNHAADPIVTRFNYKKMNLEFISVLRNDTQPPMWAIPGGMVDAGEEFSATLKREFVEEVASKCDKHIIDKLFANGKTIYCGMVYNDPRTTDNAWIETKVVNYHISYQDSLKLKLTNQDEENYAVKWISCSHPQLYADHKDYIKKVKWHYYKKYYYFTFYSLLMFALINYKMKNYNKVSYSTLAAIVIYKVFCKNRIK